MYSESLPLSHVVQSGVSSRPNPISRLASDIHTALPLCGAATLDSFPGSSPGPKARLPFIERVSEHMRSHRPLACCCSSLRFHGNRNTCRLPSANSFFQAILTDLSPLALLLRSAFCSNASSFFPPSSEWIVLYSPRLTFSLVLLAFAYVIHFFCV